jgi:membrane-associated phospholipid phosphatase
MRTLIARAWRRVPALRRRGWISITFAGGAFVALATSAHLGLLNTFDTIIREWARPDDEWGSAQLRADYVVEGLRPIVVASVLAALTIAICVIRRSPRPAFFVGGVWLVTVAITYTAKLVVGRPDTHGIVDRLGGSFPSGHTISVIVCLGLGVLIAQRRVGRWVWLIPALVGVLMGASLVVQAAHWSTDILGSGLLATVVLIGASSSYWHKWSRVQP